MVLMNLLGMLADYVGPDQMTVSVIVSPMTCAGVHYEYSWGMLSDGVFSTRSCVDLHTE